MTDYAIDDILPAGHPRAAYIGVSGERHRLLVPVRRIWIERAEGPFEALGEWTFEGPNAFGPANAQLGSNQSTAPKGGGYDKHDFQVAWVDGFTYRGRFDLQNDGLMPSLDGHIRQFLTFIRDEERAKRLFSEEDRRHAAMTLATYDIGQGVVAAPEDWQVHHDFRTGEIDFADLGRRLFASLESD